MVKFITFSLDIFSTYEGEKLLELRSRFLGDQGCCIILYYFYMYMITTADKLVIIHMA